MSVPLTGAWRAAKGSRATTKEGLVIGSCLCFACEETEIQVQGVAEPHGWRVGSLDSAPGSWGYRVAALSIVSNQLGL